ncbi:TIGR01457 family HAD-type hydrolase [Virgibacillus salexigens]|uniref:Acid sugar phosphatase n=1 Tax=Virgibacillus kapii TaxID=1638645 RepID=A0ABQ2DLA7_9BACI|nr:TIGR01457 family HAD-type hydrolase [Virgibacillus kapii]GGJ62547.1 haloacid dehalogenase [Virgibacillus kapii]
MTKSYHGYLIDLDGTMYKGEEPIEAAADFVAALNAKQIPYVYVTNNSSKTQEAVAEKLTYMGTTANKDQVVTTSIATANYIKAQKHNASCYVIGEEGIHQAIQKKGLTITENEDCDFVVIGIDRDITYEKLAKASIAVRNGATFISTNGDVAIPNERGLLPGNGALTSVIARSTGIDPIFIGKPESIIIEEALNVLDLEKEEVVMVGDNYNTDIRAGIDAGIDTLMVFTGVTPFEAYASLEKAPTYFVHQLDEWIKNIE